MKLSGKHESTINKLCSKLHTLMSLSFGLLSQDFHSENGLRSQLFYQDILSQITYDPKSGRKKQHRKGVVPREHFLMRRTLKVKGYLISSSSLSLPWLQGVCLWVSLNIHTCQLSMYVTF